MRLVRRLSIVVTCQTCGSGVPVAMTVTPTGPHSVRVLADREDQALCELFTRAHAGPFRPRRRVIFLLRYLARLVYGRRSTRWEAQ